MGSLFRWMTLHNSFKINNCVRGETRYDLIQSAGAARHLEGKIRKTGMYLKPTIPAGSTFVNRARQLVQFLVRPFLESVTWSTAILLLPSSASPPRRLLPSR